jgi:hypothetical protein
MSSVLSTQLLYLLTRLVGYCIVNAPYDVVNDVGDRIVDVCKLIINPVLKNLLVQIEMVYELSIVSKIVLHRIDLRWCHIWIKRTLVARVI